METREPGITMPTINQQLPTAWMVHGECRGIGPTAAERFFGDVTDQQRAALEYCMDCPVRQQCLRYGEATKSSGVWGGRILVDGLAQARKPRRTVAAVAA